MGYPAHAGKDPAAEIRLRAPEAPFVSLLSHRLCPRDTGPIKKKLRISIDYTLSID